jgi:hypothetical protein
LDGAERQRGGVEDSIEHTHVIVSLPPALYRGLQKFSVWPRGYDQGYPLGKLLLF